MSRILKLCVLLVGVLVWTGNAQAAGVPNTDYDLYLSQVALRAGVTTNLHVKMYVNEKLPCNNRTLLAIHGHAHSAATFAPLAEALFERNPTGLPVCRVAALDLPGHGQSSVPTGLTYSELTLDDYVTAVQGALDKLENNRVSIHILVAHSQGGLIVQMLQQRLLNQSSSLMARHGISKAILLAPAPPAGLAWNLVDSGAINTLLANFLVPDYPGLGAVIYIPELYWPTIYFSNYAGQVAAGTPDPAQMDGWASPEPLYGSSQLVGLPPFTRPVVKAGALKSIRGTVTFVVGFEQDTVVLAQETRAIYEHITSDLNDRLFAVVPGADSVHDLYISNPRALLQSVAGTVVF